MNELTELLYSFIDFSKNIKNRSLAYQRYFYHVRKFNQYMIVKKGYTVKPEDIELTDILEYLNVYKTSKIIVGPKSGTYPSRNALYNHIVSIRMFFKYITIVGRKLKFNWEQIPIFRMEDVRREPMKKEDYELLHSAPLMYNDSDRQDIILRDTLMFEIPRETGLRRAELSRLKFEHFHTENRQFEIEVKGGRMESVFFSENLRKKVLQYEEVVRKKYKFHDIEYLFFYMGQKEIGKHMTPKVIGITVRTYVNKLKKDGKVDMNKKLCLHQERHSFAMRCVYSGLSQQATTQLMRHKDPKITLHYYHLNDSRLKNQYDKIQ